MTGPASPEESRAASGLELLRTNRDFRRLWLARTISFVGDSLGLIALLLYTANATGDAFAVALLLVAGDLVPSMASPLTGVLSDRVDRRALMVGCELLRGAVVTIIAAVQPSLTLLLVLVGLQALAGGAFQPASRSAVPHLVDDRDLAGANATIGFGTHGLEVMGPVLAAIALPLLGLRGVLLADAATFVASAALLVRLPPLHAGPQRERLGSFVVAAQDGLRAIWSRPVVRAIALAFFAFVAFNGIDDVALVFLAHDLRASDTATSLLYAGSGAGLTIGLLLLTHWTSLVPAMALLVAGFALCSTGNLLTGLAWAVPVAFATQAVRGGGISAIETGVTTVLQKRVPPRLQGRVFGNVLGSVGLAAGLSYLVGGRLVELVGPRPVFVGAGTGGLVTAAALAVALLCARSR